MGGGGVHFGNVTLCTVHIRQCEEILVKYIFINVIFFLFCELCIIA